MNDLITTQRGNTVRPFQAYSDEERLHLLSHCKRLLSDLKSATGIDTFLSYGALLGAVRSGSLIPYDVSIDVGFFLPEGASTSSLTTVKKIVDFLVHEGYHIQPESNGHFKAYRQDSNFTIDLDFFAAWIEENRLFHYFAVRGASIVNDMLPLGEIDLEGVLFPAPRQPESLLAAIYGIEWKTPDPNFKYTLTTDDWAPFKFLFTNTNQRFWDSYYQNQMQNKVWVETPSAFALFASERLKSSARVLDIGCGNGRDGLYLASLGCDVTFADYSSQALEVVAAAAEKRGLLVRTCCLSVASLPEITEFQTVHSEHFDIVYARFFLHAIDEVAQKNLLDTAYHVLVKGGQFLLEYRCSPLVREADPVELHYENGEHYRRLVDVPAFFNQAIEIGFDLTYTVTGHGLAAYRSEDPLITRCILTKRCSS